MRIQNPCAATNSVAGRFMLPLNFLGIYILYALALRLALTCRSWEQITHSPLRLTEIFGLGFFYDLMSGLYVLIPFTLYLLIVPQRVFDSRWNRWLVGLLLFAAIYGLGLASVAEWLFWDEFGTRFNFIVVDYLVYTHEVFGNIRESYPLTLLCSGLFMLTGGVYFAARNRLHRHLDCGKRTEERVVRRGFRVGAALLLLPVFFFFLVGNGITDSLPGRYEKELAENGLYQLFSAFRANSLDYETFYQTIDPAMATTGLRFMLDHDNGHFLHRQPMDTERLIATPGPEAKPNVVLVMMESMSAEFMAAFGNRDGLTPNLDHLAANGLLFANLYATGTRTVRGMEAVTLSIPPTPGRSIVKRPDNDNLFSMGFIFREKGYAATFLYGGYGYFDNMNSFFSNNGFDIVDRSALTLDEISFANIWGVCDEDIFHRAVRQFDQQARMGKPFLGYIMTTSNHRPYTYPTGRIDIPPGAGRAGGVKYADYAIGAFIAEAQNRPWFKNTLFVFVADHCAASAGREELPLHRYHIPAIIYQPGVVQPAQIDTLASQIDLVPTVLGMLRWSYRSKFFGRDIMRADFTPRALLGNYQKLGYLKDGRLTILNERKQLHQYRIVHAAINDTVVEEENPVDEKLRREAICYYEGASLLYKNNLYRRQ